MKTKTQARKLTLGRETIATLSSAQLTARGGDGTDVTKDLNSKIKDVKILTNGCNPQPASFNNPWLNLLNQGNEPSGIVACPPPGASVA